MRTMIFRVWTKSQHTSIQATTTPLEEKEKGHHEKCQSNNAKPYLLAVRAQKDAGGQNGTRRPTCIRLCSVLARWHVSFIFSAPYPACSGRRNRGRNAAEGVASMVLCGRGGAHAQRARSRARLRVEQGARTTSSIKYA